MSAELDAARRQARAVVEEYAACVGVLLPGGEASGGVKEDRAAETPCSASVFLALRSCSWELWSGSVRSGQASSRASLVKGLLSRVQPRPSMQVTRIPALG